MKKFYFLVLLILLTFNLSIQSNDCYPQVTYYHYYSENKYENGIRVPDMEDRILVFVKNPNIYRCFYYGTSDDFEEAREGYLPGFIALQAGSFVIKSGKISFHLNSTNHNFYSQPIELDYFMETDIAKAGYKLWLQPAFNCWKDVLMEGTFSEDSIILKNLTLPDPFGKGNMVFYRESEEKVKSCYNRNLIEPKYERENNIDFDGTNSIWGDGL